MNEKEKADIIEFYRKIFQSFGDDVSSVAWCNRNTQYIRFIILTTFWDIDNSSVLDIGSGLGDLWNYLKNERYNIKYTGVDIVDDFVKKAGEKYKGEAAFSCQDLNDVQGSFDYVFASGTFNYRIKNNEKYIRDQINKMFKLAIKGFSFNLLSMYAPKDAIYNDKTFYYYDPEGIFRYCKSITPYVALRHDYLPNDFTIGVSKV